MKDSMHTGSSCMSQVKILSSKLIEKTLRRVATSTHRNKFINGQKSNTRLTGPVALSKTGNAGWKISLAW